MKRSSQSSENIDVSIILVSYNTKKLILQCIKSILRTVKEVSYEIIIIDNASTDSTLTLIKKLKLKINNDSSKLKVIQNYENLGFAKANNQGIKIAKGKYIFLLNSDTIIKQDAIERLIKFANNKSDLGVVVPKLLNPDGSVQPSAFQLPTIPRAVRQYWLGEKGLLDKYAPSVKEASKIESAVMAAFLITPKSMKKVGLLDERYFMYYEDLDYCRRIKEAGLDIYYLPYSEIVHYHGASGEKEGERTQFKRLDESSRIYHGIIGYSLITMIIKLNQIFSKLLNIK